MYRCVIPKMLKSMQLQHASAEFLAAVEIDLVDRLSECSLDTDEINFLLEEVGLWSLEDNGAV